MSISEIFCQDRAISGLQRAFGAGRLAHAYIFAGADGVGKFTTAREWAKVLLCQNRVEKTEKKAPAPFFDSCGECESCRLFGGDGHPDFNVIYKELIKYTKDGKGRTTPVDMPIDVIREFLIDKVASRPMMSESTVYIVREAEKLNDNSQNALLKVLEEPPRHCFIILLCCRVERLLPTTLSRCQVVRFGPIDEERIVDKLRQMNIGDKEATYWARFSEGSIGTAVSWAQLKFEGVDCYEVKKELINRLACHQLSDSLAFAEWICQKSRQISDAWFGEDKSVSKTDITRRVQKGVLRMITGAFNDVMRVNIQIGDKLINSDQAGEIEKLACSSDAEKAARRITKAGENMQWVDASVNEKLIFEELLLNYAD